MLAEVKTSDAVVECACKEEIKRMKTVHADEVQRLYEKLQAQNADHVEGIRRLSKGSSLLLDEVAEKSEKNRNLMMELIEQDKVISDLKIREGKLLFSETCLKSSLQEQTREVQKLKEQNVAHAEAIQKMSKDNALMMDESGQKSENRRDLTLEQSKLISDLKIREEKLLFNEASLNSRL